MDHAPLDGARILIVEDDAIIALELQSILTEAGATVIGPARNLAMAEKMAENGPLSAAILDIQLGSALVFPVAERLTEQGVPFVLNTGHGDARQLAADWPDAEVLTKPSTHQAIVQSLSRLIENRAAAASHA